MAKDYMQLRIEAEDKFSTNVKRIRKELHLTQDEFAKMACLKQSHISAWESGSRIPLAVNLFILAKAIGKNVEDFFV